MDKGKIIHEFIASLNGKSIYAVEYKSLYGNHEGEFFEPIDITHEVIQKLKEVLDNQ